jgi:hypothetical protein
VRRSARQTNDGATKDGEAMLPKRNGKKKTKKRVKEKLTHMHAYNNTLVVYTSDTKKERREGMKMHTGCTMALVVDPRQTTTTTMNECRQKRKPSPKEKQKKATKKKAQKKGHIHTYIYTHTHMYLSIEVYP